MKYKKKMDNLILKMDDIRKKKNLNEKDYYKLSIYNTLLNKFIIYNLLKEGLYEDHRDDLTCMN